MDTLEWVKQLKEEHNTTWRNKPDWYWLLGLLEEVGELALSLLKLHKHTPEYELRQIASIACNWIEKRNDPQDR